MLDVQKSPKASLEDKKFTFVLMGFILALSVLYIGFEWTAKEIRVADVMETDHFFEEEMDIIQTAETPPPPPPPPPAEVIIEAINIVDDNVEVERVNLNTEDRDDIVVEIRGPVAAPVEMIDEDVDVIFQVVEKEASFPGGMQALMRWLGDNIRYPVIAQENGIQGRVTVQFVVNIDGSIVDVQVVRGVDPSLDREAVRLVQAMPRWAPGEQRGRKVRSRFTLPIAFRLQ
jgi:protein TonB